MKRRNLVYWAAERNETGSLVTVRSQAHQDPVTLVLKETTASSGEFVLEIMTVKPQDDSNPPQDVMPDTDTTPPTLPVNPRDVVTLSHPDQTGSVHDRDDQTCLLRLRARPRDLGQGREAGGQRTGSLTAIPD